MKTPKRILVALHDSARPSLPLIRKALSLAKGFGSRVEFFHADVAPLATEAIRGTARGRLTLKGPEDATVAQAARLRRKIEANAVRGVRTEVTVNRDYPPHEAIVRRAIATRADLVIAGIQPRMPGGRLFLRNTDWELVRECPCPLLLVKSSRPYLRPLVLAALDPFHAHAKPAGLERRILDAGALYARLLGGPLHAFHAFMPLVAAAPMPFAPPVAVWADPEAEAAHEQRIEAAMMALASKASISRDRVHLNMGPISSELAAAARSLRASIVVMGAVSRSGLKRAFIGSTAERVLDHLDADVLVVKPANFRTSVSPRTRSG